MEAPPAKGVTSEYGAAVRLPVPLQQAPPVPPGVPASKERKSPAVRVDEDEAEEEEEDDLPLLERSRLGTRPPAASEAESEDEEEDEAEEAEEEDSSSGSSLGKRSSSSSSSEEVSAKRARVASDEERAQGAPEAPQAAGEVLNDYGAAWHVGAQSLARARQSAEAGASITVQRLAGSQRLHAYAVFPSVAALCNTVGLMPECARRLYEVIDGTRDVAAYCFLERFEMGADEDARAVREAALSAFRDAVCDAYDLDRPIWVEARMASEGRHVAILLCARGLVLRGADQLRYFFTRLGEMMRAADNLSPELRAAFARATKDATRAFETFRMHTVPLPETRFWTVDPVTVGVNPLEPGQFELVTVPRLYACRLPPPPPGWLAKTAARDRERAAKHTIELTRYLGVVAGGKPRVASFADVFAANPDCTTVVECSYTDSGKTYATAHHISAEYPLPELVPGPVGPNDTWAGMVPAAGCQRIAWVSPRVLLNKELMIKLATLGFVSYSDSTTVSRGPIDMNEHPRVACVVDSVHRLSLRVVEDEMVGGVPSCKHVTPELDLLVLDELLTQLDSIRRKAKGDSIIDRNAAWASLSSLAALIRSAKRAIILDANAATSQVLIEFLHHCVAPESIRWRCLSNSASGSDIRRVQFVFGYDRKTGGNSCVAALVDGVAECLAAGERVAVPCSTKADARLIEAALLQRGARVTCLYDPGDARKRADMDELVARVTAGDEQPDVLIYTSIYGVGCSYDRLHFHRVFYCLSAPSSYWEDAVQGISRVRTLLSTTSGSNVRVYCDKKTHDYEAHGGPWLQQRRISDLDFRAKRVAGAPLVEASSAKKALVILRTAPEYRIATVALRERREDRFEFTRGRTPTEMTFDDARHHVLHAAQLNHHIGGELPAAEEVDATTEAELTARFHIQKLLVNWLAEYERRDSRRALECVPRLKKALTERGYELAPDAWLLCGQVPALPAAAPAIAAPPHPSKEAALRAQATPRSQRSPEEKRIIEMAYALSILGNPDGSSFAGGGGAPDPAHAYSFSEKTHLDYTMLQQLRTTSALLIESSTPEDELQRWLLRSKKERDMDALGTCNNSERRVYAHSLLKGIGFGSDFTGDVGEEDGEPLELTLRESRNAARASRDGDGPRLCRSCARLEADDDALCITCSAKMIEVARRLTAELFGHRLTRRQPFRLDNHKAWPPSGPSGARFAADEAFKREMEAALSETDKRAGGAAEQLRSYCAMLNGLTQVELRELYVRETRVTRNETRTVMETRLREKKRRELRLL